MGRYVLSQLHIDFTVEKEGYFDNEGLGHSRLQYLYLNKHDFDEGNYIDSMPLADESIARKEYDFTECKGKKVLVRGQHSYRTNYKSGMLYNLRTVKIIENDELIDCLKFRLK